MAFAIRIVNLCRYLNEEKHEHRIADQLFRSGTSIGANYAEAQCAISKKDFRSKVYDALKESNESLFWLDLLKNTGVLEQRLYDSIYRRLRRTEETPRIHNEILIRRTYFIIHPS